MLLLMFLAPLALLSSQLHVKPTTHHTTYVFVPPQHSLFNSISNMPHQSQVPFPLYFPYDGHFPPPSHTPPFDLLPMLSIHGLTEHLPPHILSAVLLQRA